MKVHFGNVHAELIGFTSLPSTKNKSLLSLFPCGMTTVWGWLAWSAGEVQHSRHESFSQGHLLAPGDKRQLLPGALSAPLLQGSIEKRGRHWALYQIFYRYESNTHTQKHSNLTNVPHITRGERGGAAPKCEGRIEDRSVFFSPYSKDIQVRWMEDF